MARPFDLIINNSVCLFMDNTLIYNSYPVIIQFPYNTVVSAWHILYYWSWITSYSLKVKVWDWGWSSLWIWILNFFTGDLFYLEKWYIYNTCALSKHIGNICMRLRNGGKAKPFLAFRAEYTYLPICFDSAHVLYF